jgi:uncharacterized SAM-binding protein YcdF (DUF218 family)
MINFRWKRLLRGIALALVSAIASAEIICYLGFSLAPNPPKSENCVVLVLGYPSNNDGTTNPVQELRVEFGVNAYRQHGCKRLVFSGSAVANKIVEAETMLQLAVKIGVEPNQITQEKQATNTWENIKYSIPLLEKYEYILIASDTIHPYRGKRYLCKQRPDICNRTFVVVSYKPFSMIFWKVTAILHELFSGIRDLIFY